MGRHSSDSNSDRSSRRRRRRSRSRSSSSNYGLNRRRHKKSKRSKYSSSRSRSPSRSRSHRSYSKSKSSRRRHSYTKSRSRSGSREHSRKHSKHKHRRRYRSSSSEESTRSDRYSKPRSNRSSSERHHRSTKERSKRSSSRERRKEKSKEKECATRASLPIVVEEKEDGEGDSKKSKEVIIDLTESEKLSLTKQIEAIDNNTTFIQKSFVSSKAEKAAANVANNKTEGTNGTDFNFGTNAELKSRTNQAVTLNDNSLFSPHLFGNPDEREERYLRRIYSMRLKAIANDEFL